MSFAQIHELLTVFGDPASLGDLADIGANLLLLRAAIVCNAKLELPQKEVVLNQRAARKRSSVVGNSETEWIADVESVHNGLQDEIQRESRAKTAGY